MAVEKSREEEADDFNFENEDKGEQDESKKPEQKKTTGKPPTKADVEAENKQLKAKMKELEEAVNSYKNTAEKQSPENNIEELIEKALESKLKKVNELQEEVKRLRSASGDHVPTTEEIVEDLLEDPAVYYSFRSSYQIRGDVRGGKEVQNPGDQEILFRPFVSYRSGLNKTNDIIVKNISVFRTVSKTMVEFLENHSSYGISFFKDSRDAEKVETDLASYIIDASDIVRRLSDHDVIERSVKLGMNREPDVGNMRKKLIREMANRKFNSVKQRGIDMVTESHLNKRSRE
jgi:hypothetical protein